MNLRDKPPAVPTLWDKLRLQAASEGPNGPSAKLLRMHEQGNVTSADEMTTPKPRIRRRVLHVERKGES